MDIGRNPAPLKAALAPLLDALASLWLTVVCLACALVLVFIGTLAEADAGLYEVQSRFFRSFALFWSPGHGSVSLPVFPGGYSIGGVLLVNLIAAHATRFRLAWKQVGILMIHFGLIVLVIGQLASDAFSREGTMRFTRGESASFAEDLREQELAIYDGRALLAAAPLEQIARANELRFDGLELSVRIDAFWPHARLLDEPAEGALRMTVTRGAGANGFYVLPLVDPQRPDDRSLPVSVVELTSTAGSLGSYVLSPLLRLPQTVEHAGRTLEIALGPQRRYLPYSLTLVDLRHDLYVGTDIPRNFSSRVRIDNPSRGERRDVVISMNHPLRYRGDTFYQYQMESASDVSILQVVRNPSWLTPYLSCGLVGLGLAAQFLSHLVGFARRRPA